MKKTIFISGGIIGTPSEQAKLKFQKKQQELEKRGHKVINPYAHIMEIKEAVQQLLVDPFLNLILPEQLLNSLKSIENFDEHMKEIVRLLLKCDELHLLSCWNESNESIIVRDIAMRLHIPIVYP